MGYYVVDWDDKLIHVPARILHEDLAEDFLSLTGPIERARQIKDSGLMHQKKSISLIGLGPEITLDVPIIFRQYWHYIPPEECRTRAEQAYQALRSSEAAWIDRLVYIYVDGFSLGSIMNGVVV